MKASAVLGEVFVTCDNCDKNIKTAQGLKDHCDQAYQNLPKFTINTSVNNAITKTSMKMG